MANLFLNIGGTNNFSFCSSKGDKVGIRGTALDWFDNYLQNRLQVVSVDGSLSDHLDLSLGVPQGSVLGPLLLIIFVTDLSFSIYRCKLVILLILNRVCYFICVVYRTIIHLSVGG